MLLLSTKRVDDIKVAGPPEDKARFRRCPEKAFGAGEFDISEGTFTCCGTRRSPTTDGGYELDQHDYILALKPIGGTELTGRSNDYPASPELAKLYLSLLMALAYTLITRVDLHVYVVALQRHASNPTCGQGAS